ncbi:MAG: hypothetical protein ONB06_12055, partial [candidate division KSB1 bacterium]|nr:hypothetical protein [candidate division KSB1 bacterium]
MVRLFGPTPSQIWRFPERSIQVVTANWLVPTDRWFQPWAWTIGRLYTSGECEGLTAADDDGLTGNYTTETETLSRDYFTGI